MMKFNENQLKQLAEFTANLGLAFFATVVIPTFVAIDKLNPFMIISGLVLTAGCLAGSLLLLKGDDK